MNEAVHVSWRWADQFEPAMRGIISDSLVRVATREQDTKEATDMVVFSVAGGTVGCRVRKEKYARRWPFDWTVRIDRPSGAPSELHKIVELGKPDWYLYGFGRDGGDLFRWALIDMGRFRRRWMSYGTRGFGVVPDTTHESAIRGERRENGDGSSTFVAIDLRSVRSCVLACSDGFWLAEAA